MDERGTWYNVEPGTNLGFLYQQNTIIDVLVAGTNLDYTYGDEKIPQLSVSALVDNSNAHNTFEQPEAIQPIAFKDAASVLFT